MKNILRVATVVIAFSSFALAHGGHKHVKGTVEKVNATSIVIKTEDKGSMTIPFNSSTQWENNKVAGGPKDVHPGARVIVDMPESGENIAEKVRYGTTEEQKHPHKKARTKPASTTTSK